MSLIRKHVAVLQAWACLALVFYSCNSCVYVQLQSHHHHHHHHHHVATCRVQTRDLVDSSCRAIPPFAILLWTLLYVVHADCECDKTVSVLLDGHETTLSFVELPLTVQKVGSTSSLYFVSTSRRTRRFLTDS